MNKKWITLTITICCFVLASILIVVYVFHENIMPKDNLFNTDNSGQIDASSSQLSQSSSISNNESANKEESKHIAVLLREGAEYVLPWVDEIHKGNESDDIYIKLESIETAKDNRGMYIYGDHSTDEDVYVFASITMENYGDRSCETTLNRFYLIAGSDNGYELRGYNSGKDDEMTQDYYHVLLQPHEKVNYCLVYIAPKKILDENKNEVFLYVSFINSSSGGWVSYLPIIDKEE